MTGTAATESEEFHKIYKTDVIVIPTHMCLMIRKDHSDMIYKTERAKFNAVVDEIIQNYKVGRPVLVELLLSRKRASFTPLNEKGIPHELLNAKIMKGKQWSLLMPGKRVCDNRFATKMAGRGVDIILGGEQLDSAKMKEWEKKHDQVVS